MCVDTRIPSCASQRLVVSVRNVLSSLRVSVSFSKAEINHIYHVLLLLNPYQEVIWLHIPVDEVIIVKKFNPLNHLLA